MTHHRLATALLLAFALCSIEAGVANAVVTPGDIITARDAWKVVDLVSPGNWCRLFGEKNVLASVAAWLTRRFSRWGTWFRWVVETANSD